MEPSAAAATASESTLTEVAYHYEPGWGRAEGDWLKTLLLFFDGLAVLVPEYAFDRPLVTDPALAQPLVERGLLHRLSPEALVDHATTEALTELFDTLINAGAFDDLDRSGPFAELSYSRLGRMADAGLTDLVLEQLRDRGLAEPSQDGVSVPLHPVIRTLVLIVLPHLLRAPAEAAGYALQPVANRPVTVRALLQTLEMPVLPTAGHVVSVDLEHVAVDLTAVPLDEVLDFRRQYGGEYRAYARDLRQFVRDLAVLDPDSRDQALADRTEALTDTAEQLRQHARTSWRRPLASFGLGIAGSAVSLAAGNPVPAVIGIASALLGFRRHSAPASAYTYLFRAQDRLSRP